jgi:hypothetical protein
VKIADTASSHLFVRNEKAQRKIYCIADPDPFWNKDAKRARTVVEELYG